MTSQTDIDNWASESEPTDTEENNNVSTDDPDPEVSQNEKPNTGTEDSLPQSLRDQVEQFREARLREIPFKERYPVWWGRLRAKGMSVKSLAEMERTSSKADYHYDDREEDLYNDQFAEIHLHTDLGDKRARQ